MGKTASVVKMLARYVFLIAAILSAGLIAVDWFGHKDIQDTLLWFLCFLGSFLLASVDFILRPKLAGRWEYTVATEQLDFSHRGECTIQQDGERIWITGYRLYTCALKSRRRIEDPVNQYWETSWCEVCDDGRLRFLYHIDTTDRRREEEKIHGFCQVPLTERKPSKMSGKYTLVPPFHDETLNCIHGSIKFRRIKNEDPILAPSAGDLDAAARSTVNGG
jgi:hypothetical protein